MLYFTNAQKEPPGGLSAGRQCVVCLLSEDLNVLTGDIFHKSGQVFGVDFTVAVDVARLEDNGSRIVGDVFEKSGEVLRVDSAVAVDVAAQVVKNGDNFFFRFSADRAGVKLDAGRCLGRSDRYDTVIPAVTACVCKVGFIGVAAS